VPRPRACGRRGRLAGAGVFYLQTSSSMPSFIDIIINAETEKIGRKETEKIGFRTSVSEKVFTEKIGFRTSVADEVFFFQQQMCENLSFRFLF
jgi:hypothetical protein